jgi:alpha-tubulin suppressor-like RCC1 family protein
VAALGAGAFEAAVDLKPGNNAYTVIATDTAGNRSTREGTVYFGQRTTAGGSHSGLLANGKLYTWGRNNLAQTGLGFTSTLSANPNTHPQAPVEVATSEAMVSLAFNQNHSVALGTSGKLWSWGADNNGQLGRGDTGRDTCTGTTPNCRKAIGEVQGLERVVAVAAGYNHVIALREDGTVWAFGLNSNGQLGDGSTASSSQPVLTTWTAEDAANLGRVVQVSGSSASSFALDDRGQVWGWGRDTYANLGQGSVGTYSATPKRVPIPPGVFIVSIANGRDHTLALAKDGRVYAWGLNASSQVGFNGAVHNKQPTAWPDPVVSPRRLPATDTQLAVAVYANGNTSYLRRADGKVYPWGMYGETEGRGSTVYANLDEPADKLPTLSNIVDLGVGALHQVARRNDGQLFSWGWSFQGSLGGGLTTIDTWMYNTPLNPQLPTSP